MNPPTDAEAVGVRQEDREAAADYAMNRLRWNRDCVEALEDGRADADPLVQAFARHRIAALEEAAKVIRDTRALVVGCCDSGFTDEDAVMALYQNNGVLTRFLESATLSREVAP